MSWDDLDLAQLEAELLLLGVWHNVEHLEESLNLPEIRVILNAAREREYRRNRFMAAIQGINLDDNVKQEQEEAFDRVQRRVQARLSGKSAAELEHADLGFDFEIED